MDENEKKETDETLKADANEAPKTDEANETSKTDVKEQPKKEKIVVTAKDKFAMYSVIAFLIAIPFCIIVTIAVNEDNDTDTSTSSSYSSDYDTDEDYDTSSDDDTSTTSSFSDDYSALDYESQNCYDTAMSYLDFMAFSRNGLIHQLQYDGYTDNAISNALDLLEKDYVSWDIEALKKAQEYMETFSFSQQRLYEQLIHDGFTEEQANYGASYVYNNN